MEPIRRTTLPTTRFPGIGGDGNSSSEVYGEGTVSRRSSSRNGDDRGFERWKETIREQNEDQALLHQTVVTSKKQQLDIQYERLAKQRAFIRQEKRKLLLQNAFLESEKDRFEASLTSDWFCLSVFPTVHDRRITVDVGGHLLEISSQVATKDPTSMLAAFMKVDDSPLSTLECGCFRVDRDWWLFRYVLHFLRDGLLPQDPKLLRELYLESEFWQMNSLRKAIEMRNMELLQIKQVRDLKTAATVAHSLRSGDSVSTFQSKYHMDSTSAKTTTGSSNATSHDNKSWWLDAPTWWGLETKSAKLAAVAAAATKKAREEELAKIIANDPDAWWQTTTYKGNDFTRVLHIDPSADATKDKQGDGEKNTKVSSQRVPVVTNSTWQSTTSHT